MRLLGLSLRKLVKHRQCGERVHSKLVEGVPNRGVFIGATFQLDDGDGQAISLFRHPEDAGGAILVRLLRASTLGLQCFKLGIQEEARLLDR
jgi:hypothetical protein